MSIFSVITFGIICVLIVWDILGFVGFLLGITVCSVVFVRRCMRKHASKEVVALTEVLCTEPISKSMSRPTIPNYLNTFTSPTISYYNIPLYNNTSTIHSISPIHSFHYNTYTSPTPMPTSPMSTFSCSTPTTSTVPLPPFLNKSVHYMVSNLY